MIAITSGEPSGIGPDICLQLAVSGQLEGCVVFGAPELFEQRAEELGLDVMIQTASMAGECHSGQAGELWVQPFELAEPVIAGHLNPGNSQYVLNMLRSAATGCYSGQYSAMVTAPVHKGVINDAGIAFSGHTEFLQAIAGVPRVVMMLASEAMRVALVTTHIPLAQVASAITPRRLESVIRVLHADLIRSFGIESPKILVAGLNPHAGEGGHLGTEEIRVIEPLLKRLREEGMRLVGPLPADTLFSREKLASCDAVLAMYHDQGLPVLKYQSFGQAANITLGLPFIRTSVDHGTALELAGKGGANPGSLKVAINYARQMSRARQQVAEHE